MSGNYNSGGHNCTHGKYENVPRVDSYSIYNMIDKLRNASMSYRWSLEWCRGKQKKKCAGITVFYDATQDKLYFLYRLNENDKKQQVEMVYISNHYGGHRMYFCCPDCGKRVRFLCASEKGFVCRFCARLNYHVQQSSRDEILADRIEKLLHLLEVDTELMNRWDMTTFKDVERPRYMRKKKFVMLMSKLLQGQEEYWVIQYKALKRISG